ncbi:MAG TPA: nuclear transport factor 2 family protein [Pseudomonas sp.]|nr:nuclear transport factor 2 family protein [Pseudomonas sp.]
MNKPTPSDAVAELVAAINQGDVAAATALYEEGASFVAQPGKMSVGTEALREALAGLIALKPILTTLVHRTIQTGEVALYCGQWTLTGTAADGRLVHMSGTSSDVLRQQSNGRWLVAIDNPWGPAILG